MATWKTYPDYWKVFLFYLCSGLQGNTANQCDLFIWTLLHRKFLARNTYFWGNHLLYGFLKMFWFHLFCSCIISTDTNKYRKDTVFKICFEYKRKGWVTNTNSLFCIPNSKSYPYPLMHMKKKQTKLPNCFYSQFQDSLITMSKKKSYSYFINFLFITSIIS